MRFGQQRNCCWESVALRVPLRYTRSADFHRECAPRESRLRVHAGFVAFLVPIHESMQGTKSFFPRGARLLRRGAAGLFAGAAVAACAAPSGAQDDVPVGEIRLTPLVSLTGDWLAARGGVRDGSVFLAKPEARFTFEDQEHHSLVLDVGAMNGQSIAGRAGDAQGTSNIEAPRAARVFDFFYETPLQHARRTLLRAGIIDLNAFFYVQGDAASIFMNSSHGIGPEFSHSGRNGPSVFPNMGLAAMVEHSVGDATARLGVFDAEPNDPAHPARMALHLPGTRGALLVGEWDTGRARVGAWTYTSDEQRRDGTGTGHGDAGAYGITQFQPAESVGSWLTAGVSNSTFNRIDNYVGGGVVKKLGRKAVGVAVASAGFADGSRRETALELTAPINVGHGFSVQPDLQYVMNPSGTRGKAWVAGVRIRYSYDGSESPQPLLLRRGRLRPPPAAD